MNIINLTDHHKPLYFTCLEDWSDEIKEGIQHKVCWYKKMKDKGLRVKFAVDDNGEVGGMIQYVPIEYSFASGKDLYFISCIWVHGYKKGRGNFQKKGMGKTLLQAAEEDTRSLGAKGIAAWGLGMPFWMKASWFRKHGYIKADKTKGFFSQVLLWKPFTHDAIPPRWIQEKKKPVVNQGKVTVTGFINGWCPAYNMVFERAKRASAEFGDKVEFREINTFDRNVLEEWGIADAVFIDGKKAGWGPPLSYDKMKNLIGKRVKKLKARANNH